MSTCVMCNNEGQREYTWFLGCELSLFENRGGGAGVKHRSLEQELVVGGDVREEIPEMLSTIK